MVPQAIRKRDKRQESCGRSTAVAADMRGREG